MRRIYILLILLTGALASRAQIYQQENLFGKEAWRYLFKSAVGIPNDTIAPPLAYQNYPHLAAKDSVLYVWSPSGKRFRAISAASGGGGGSYTFLSPLSNDGGVVSLTSVPWSLLTGKPTTLSGYGITDAVRVSDTAAMLSPYVRKGTTGTGADTLAFVQGLIQSGKTVYARYQTPMWNANRVQGYLWSPGQPLDGAVPRYAADQGMWVFDTVGGSSAAVDSFTYATRRYVDSSTAVFGSRLYDTYNTHDTLTQSRGVWMQTYGLTFYSSDGTTQNATGINNDGFTSTRGKGSFTQNSTWVYGQIQDPTATYISRFQAIGLTNDSTHSTSMISTNGKTFNRKAAAVSAAWWEGVKLQVNTAWKTSGSASGYKGIRLENGNGLGWAPLIVDREVLSVGTATDSLYARDAATGETKLVAPGGGSSTTLSTLTYGATTTWNYATQGTAAKVTLTGNTTLSITNLPASVVYLTLEVVQDATGSRTLTLPAGTKVIGGGSGSVTLTTTGGATDILTFYYNGTTLYCNIGTNYN